MLTHLLFRVVLLFSPPLPLEWWCFPLSKRMVDSIRDDDMQLCDTTTSDFPFPNEGRKHHHLKGERATARRLKEGKAPPLKKGGGRKAPPPKRSDGEGTRERATPAQRWVVPQQKENDKKRNVLKGIRKTNHNVEGTQEEEEEEGAPTPNKEMESTTTQEEEGTPPTHTRKTEPNQTTTHTNTNTTPLTIFLKSYYF